MNWNNAAKKLSLALTAMALSATVAGAVNLAQGQHFTADSSLAAYTPDKAGDNNDKDKTSRWVSNADPLPHWLAVDFKKEITFNQIVLKFWNDTHIAVDFDIQKKTNSGWQTIREIRGNVEANICVAVPATTTSEMRILFIKATPDNMIRVYELEVYNQILPLDAEVSGALLKGIFWAGKTSELKIKLYQNTPEKININVKLAPTQTASTPAIDKNIAVEVNQSAAITLPAPAEYGEYSYDIDIKNNAGKSCWQKTMKFYFFPPNTSTYLTASPFGAHYYHISETITQYIGMRWWRNHDIYGLWHFYADEQGKSDWAELDANLKYAQNNQLRQCYVLIGAPRKYSTILPGEKCINQRVDLYSYYPPSDLQAWVNEYIIPVTEKVKKTARFRVYEIWNEAWSYYRLRGLHGTAGEAFELFKVSYDALKKADPQAMAYSTDVKPEAADNKYAFKSFGRDMLDLGYLRYTDLLSYHGYGMANPSHIENIRRNAWDYGRDMEMWSTETAVEGRPFNELMESLTLYRMSGNGKTFIYNGTLWAPLMENGNPTMNLVGQAALIRNLGDTLPLGYSESDGIRQYLFANGAKAVAVLFTDNPTPVKINVPLSVDSQVTDVFSRKLDPQQPILTQSSPIFISNPAISFVKSAMATKIKTCIDKNQEATILGSVANKIMASADADLMTTINDLEQKITTARKVGSDEFLYNSNKVLDLLINCRIMLTRRANIPGKATATLQKMQEKLAAQWQAIYAKTNHNGTLLNTERLTSRAQKQIQYATMFEDDNDAVARNILLACADNDLANAQARMSSEQISNVYKTKTYFRSHKRDLRSELYCFPNGRWQEAVITLANPYGKELHGNLIIELPAGWEIKDQKIAYSVAPTSRQLINLSLKAPENFSPDWKGKINVRDETGNFPTIAVDCEILNTIPPAPVLKGEISNGVFTGN